MSRVYILEPPTKGKVVLKSTVGDIDIELWSKECPLACKNFIQHCLDGYYDGTLFHRVVTGFIVQGGDPTGTGEGGEAAFGQPFKDEFHSRLRFNRRGLVGVAKTNGENKSQFFFTLDEAAELDKTHTLFGKVVGNTMFNMLRLADGEIEDEKPVYPHKIISTEILSNPFPELKSRKVENSPPQQTEPEKPKYHSKAVKNFGLLSFGEEAEEDEYTLEEMRKKIEIKAKSAHDINDPQLLSEPIAVVPFTVSLPDDVKKDLLKEETEEERLAAQKAAEVEAEKNRIREEIKVLKKELKTALEKEAKKKLEEQTDDGSFVTKFNRDAIALYRSKEEIHARKGTGKDRESLTMQLLEKFKRKMEDPSTEEGEINPTIKTLFEHELESTETLQIRAMDANRDDDPERYDIYDPRNPINKRRRENDQKVEINMHRTRHML